MPGPLVSPQVRRMISELYGARVTSPLDADYRPLSNPSLFGDAGFTTIGVQPTDVAPMPLGPLSLKRRRLSLLFSGDSYESPQSL